MNKKEERRAQLLKKCKHFTGIQNKACEVGVNYDDVKDKTTSPFRWACMYDGADIPCVLREYPTAKELDEDDKRTAKMIEDMLIARKAITDRTGGARNVQGRVACPVCKYGDISYGVAYNGHIHAKCSTDDCVNWIE